MSCLQARHGSATGACKHLPGISSPPEDSLQAGHPPSAAQAAATASLRLAKAVLDRGRSALRHWRDTRMQAARHAGYAGRVRVAATQNATASRPCWQQTLVKTMWGALGQPGARAVTTPTHTHTHTQACQNHRRRSRRHPLARHHPPPPTPTRQLTRVRTRSPWHRQPAHDSLQKPALHSQPRKESRSASSRTSRVAKAGTRRSASLHASS